MLKRFVLPLLFLFIALLKNYATKPFAVEQKPGTTPIAVKATPPSFLREGDRINFTANIQNSSDSELTGQVELQLLDPVSKQSVDGWFRNFYPNQYFTVPAKGQVQAGFSLEVPYQYLHSLQYKIIIRSGNFTNRDENLIPVLSSRQLITESFPLYMQGQSSKNFVFEKLRNSGQLESLQHQSFSIEWSSQTFGFIVQAIAVLHSKTMVSSEEIISALVAQQVLLMIYQKHSKLALYDLIGKDSLAMELPDSNECVHNSEKMILQLLEFQNKDGGFSWLKGTGSDVGISLKTMEQLAWLKQHAPLSTDPMFKSLCTNALAYLDASFLKKVAELNKKGTGKSTHPIGDFELKYLLLRSNFPENAGSVPLSAAILQVTKKSTTLWQQFTPARQAMVALLAHHNNQQTLAETILDVLGKQAILSENETRHWKDATPENQALMMEAFITVKNKRNYLLEMERWLLEQKKGVCWVNTVTTSSAIRALLLISQQQAPVKIQTGIQAGKLLISNDDTETGMHYFKKSLEGEQTNPTLGAITVKQTFSKQEISNSLNWGAAYWSYLEPLEKITQAPSTLHLEKKLYRQSVLNGKKTWVPLQEFEAMHPGDTLMVKLFIKNELSLDHVHLQEAPHATLQVANIQKGMHWQGKLGYFCSPSATTIHYYFNQLPKGNFVIEYKASAMHTGEFSSGISSIECTYQPAIVSYTQSGQISVESQTP